MKVLHNAYNSYVNAEYQCNKYSNEVLTDCLQVILQVILEQMLWLGVGSGQREGV